MYNKSALTDHATQDNHVIDWEGVQVVDRETHQKRRQVREAIWIRRTDALNRDEGSYDLSHVFDDVILPGNPNTKPRRSETLKTLC